MALILVALAKVLLARHLPLIFTGDSVEYAVNALILHDTGSFSHFNSWRMPGYPVLLAALTYLAPLTAAATVLHITAGLATALLAGLLTQHAAPHRRFIGPLTVLLIGLDPIGLMYERMLLTETLCTLAFSASTWLALDAANRPTWAAAAFRLALAAIVLALATLVRANFQVFTALVPLVVGMAWFFGVPARANGLPKWLRAAALVTLGWAVAATCLLPRVIHNGRSHDRYTLAIGSGFTRMLGLTDAGLINLDNPTIFSPAQHLAIIERSKQPWFSGYEVLDALNHRSLLADRFTELSPWTAADARAALLADDSVRHRQWETFVVSTRAFAHLAGFPIGPGSTLKENRWWYQRLAPTAGPTPTDPASPSIAPPSTSNWWADPATFTHLDPLRVNAVAAATRTSIDAWKRSAFARIFEWSFIAAEVVRPIIAFGALAGLVALARHGRWPLAALLALPLIHHAILAFHLFSGIDRYAAPFYPAMSIASVCLLAFIVPCRPVCPPPSPTAR